jgi:hypothetical protein
VLKTTERLYHRYEGPATLYIRNFRLSGTPAPNPQPWDRTVNSTLGTAWWFPTPMVDGKSIDFPPPGGAPGPGSSAHFPGGLIGYGGTSTKTLLPNKTAVYWNGFILSRDQGQTWFKGPDVLAAEVVGYPGHPGGAGDASPWAGISSMRKPRGGGGYAGLGFAGFEPGGEPPCVLGLGL